LFDEAFLQSDGIIMLKTNSEVTAEDVEDVRASVDRYLEGHDRIHGVLVEDWEGLAEVVGQLRFVRDYHERIERVALLTDTYLPPGADALATHFIGATVQHFPYSRSGDALKWLRSAGGERGNERSAADLPTVS
jgi:hypothetical protein